MAADGIENPPVFDPPAGFSNHPFFERKLRYGTARDSIGRNRLAAYTIHECDECRPRHQ